MAIGRGVRYAPSSTSIVAIPYYLKIVGGLLPPRLYSSTR